MELCARLLFICKRFSFSGRSEILKQLCVLCVFILYYSRLLLYYNVSCFVCFFFMYIQFCILDLSQTALAQSIELIHRPLYICSVCSLRFHHLALWLEDYSRMPRFLFSVQKRIADYRYGQRINRAPDDTQTMIQP